MTSDKAEKRPSGAMLKMQFALGEKRINLDDLRDDEFVELLEKNLREIDLRELRGFRPLRDVLTTGGNVPLEIDQQTSLIFPSDLPFRLQDLQFGSQTVVVSRGLIKQDIVYRHIESGKETHSRFEFENWSRHEGFIDRGTEKVLLLKRPPNHTKADENLWEVSYEFKKVRLQPKWRICRVWAEQITIGNFRKHFGKKTEEIAVNLLWEVSSLYQVTVEELTAKADAMQTQSIKFERLGNSISYRRL